MKPARPDMDPNSDPSKDPLPDRASASLPTPSATTPGDEQAWDRQLSAFLNEQANMGGARLIALLRSHPGEAFHCAKLSHLAFPPEAEALSNLARQAGLARRGISAAERNPGATLSIRSNPAGPQRIASKHTDAWDLAEMLTARHFNNPLTDSKTRSDIAKRKAALEAELARNPAQPALLHELQALRAYLRETTYAGGKPRYHHPELAKCYQSLFQMIRRLLGKLNGEQAPLRNYIRKHLRTGEYFQWH
ncbi:MAG: hypothetical protein LHW57_03230 [Candidatus Cloacimonetes bacterium]|nr:hypothetical protein [Candidatus Cloacimonadota bacterium]